MSILYAARPFVLGATLLTVCCATPGDRDQRERTAAPRPEGFGTVTVTVRNLPNDDGQLLINLFVAPKGFPNDPDAAHEARAVEIAGGQAQVRFEAVPAGEFAIAVFHDEDMDEELDKNLLGIPSENWGVSGENDSFMGPPSFEAASRVLEAGQDLVLEVEVGN